MTQPIRSRQQKTFTPWWQKRTTTIIIAVLGLIVVLVAMNINIFKHESHLATGNTVLLKLAPIDPRGFMQGDYMALSYALEREVFDALPPDSANAEEDTELEADKLAQDNAAIEADNLQAEANSEAIEASEFESENAAFEAESQQFEQNFRKYDPREGYVIVKIDSNNVGQFARLADSQPATLAANEVAIFYRARNGVVKIATNAFFFQEGHAKAFENAEYGLFRVNDRGEPLLTDMVNSEFKVIEPDVKSAETDFAQSDTTQGDTLP